MKTLTAIVIALSLFLGSCSSEPVKIRPEYKGVDPAFRSLVKDFMSVSAENHVEFTGTVSIGFKKLSGDRVGVCTLGGWFREIDIDQNYWQNSTELTHLALLFHELTHCYCKRTHDYANGEMYPPTPEARWDRALRWLKDGGPRPGYWDDGCPVSLLYPVVMDDSCMREHYNEYMTEMFNRCKPW